MDFKTFSQRTGLNLHTVKQAFHECCYPLMDCDATPETILEENILPLAVVAVLTHHGIQGAAVREVLRRIKSQLADGKSQLRVDFRGDAPVVLEIDISQLRRRLAA